MREQIEKKKKKKRGKKKKNKREERTRSVSFGRSRAGDGRDRLEEVQRAAREGFVGPSRKREPLIWSDGLRELVTTGIGCSF